MLGSNAHENKMHRSYSDYLKTTNEKSIFINLTTSTEIANITLEINGKKANGLLSITNETLVLNCKKSK